MGWELNVNARGQLLLDETEDDTTLTFNLQVGHGARFAPGQLRKLVIYEGNFFDSPADAINRGKGECVRQTDQTGDTITIVRGLDGTTPIADFGDPEQKKWFIENFADAGTIGFNWISVLSFGAVGDGVADDSDAFDECFQAVPSGSTVYVPEGLYLLDAWPVAGRTYDKVLNIVGEGSGSQITRTVASPYTGTFINISDAFTIKRVTFTHWLTPLILDALDSSVSVVSIEDVGFSVCGSALTWLTYVAGGNVNILKFRNNSLVNLDDHGVRLVGEWDSCEVSGNFLLNMLNGRGISLGRSVASEQGRWTSQDVVNNIIRNVTKGALGIARGIEVFGQGGTVTGNEINGVSDGTPESVGIHLECVNSTVSGNHISSVEGSTRSIGINIAGNDLSNGEPTAPDGYSVVVSDNTIELFNGVGTMGILAGNDKVIVTNNHVSLPRVIGIGGDVATRAHSDILIAGNVVTLGTVEGVASCIYASTSGDRWHMSDNILSGGTYGIRIGVNASVDNFSIVGNSIYNGVTGGILFSGPGQVATLRIQTNHFSNTVTAVNIGSTIPANDVTVTYNTYSAVTVKFLGPLVTNLTRVEPDPLSLDIDFYNVLRVNAPGYVALAAGGRYGFSAGNGIYSGSGVPAAGLATIGSLYLRTGGASKDQVAYVHDGTNWFPLLT